MENKTVEMVVKDLLLADNRKKKKYQLKRNIQILQGIVNSSGSVNDNRFEMRWLNYSSIFHSLSQNATMKQLLKSSTFAKVTINIKVAPDPRCIIIITLAA